MLQTGKLEKPIYTLAIRRSEAMNARFLTLLTTLAFLGFSVTAVAKGKPVKPGGGDPMYIAELTQDFVFISGDLTSARKGKSLPGNYMLGVEHNGNGPFEVEGKKGGIFAEGCSALLTPDGVEAFDVPDDWGISFTRSKGGPDQIHITMNDLIISSGTSTNYSQVDFDLHLHGEIAENADFLPASSGLSVSHTLTRYMLWAGGHGVNGWFICNSTGGGMDSWELLPKEITLTITLK
jgi:hypothetical protein